MRTQLGPVFFFFFFFCFVLFFLMGTRKLVP
jgi:hypothetical protein